MLCSKDAVCGSSHGLGSGFIQSHRTPIFIDVTCCLNALTILGWSPSSCISIRCFDTLPSWALGAWEDRDACLAVHSQAGSCPCHCSRRSCAAARLGSAKSPLLCVLSSKMYSFPMQFLEVRWMRLVSSCIASITSSFLADAPSDRHHRSSRRTADSCLPWPRGTFGSSPSPPYLSLRSTSLPNRRQRCADDVALRLEAVPKRRPTHRYHRSFASLSFPEGFDRVRPSFAKGHEPGRFPINVRVSPFKGSG